MDWLDFIKEVNKIDNARILELGTQRTNPLVSTLMKSNFNNYSEYLGMDLEEGIDVDIVGDIHNLSKVVGEESFDAIISIVTFEHLKYPFLASYEIMKSLKIGGWLMLDTVHTFSLHSYPNDYFRFSTEALRALFGSLNGFNIVDAFYYTRLQIVDMNGNPAGGGGVSWNTSALIGQKVAKTPDNFIYEFEYSEVK